MPHELQEEELECEEVLFDEELDAYAELSELAETSLPPNQEESEEQPEHASAFFASNEKINANTTTPSTATADFEYEYFITISPSDGQASTKSTDDSRQDLRINVRV